ncbi:hypothetical protein N9C03_00385 [bacterium]|nr:hypothetical protein [bacterium]
MADQKISELTALTGANVADDDAIAIVDTSATETKKIVFSELKNALDTATGFVRITGDTMTGALDVQSTITSDGLTVDGDTNSDPSLAHFYNINTGAAAETTAYITNSAAKADGLFLQQLGSGFTTTGGFVQDGSTIGSGTGASGGLSIMTRANADMRFYTNGHTNERMRITSSGRVGIGTDAPSSLATIQGSSSGQNVLQLSNSAGSSNGDAENGLRVTCNGNTHWGNLNVQAYETIFSQNGTERMRIDDSGNVGIGTSSPSAAGSGYGALDVRGASGGGIRYGVDGGFNMLTYATGSATDFYASAASDMRFFTQGNSTASMLIDSSGNVGIGTSSLAGLKLVALGATGYPETSGVTQTGVLRLTGGTGLYNVLDMGVNESTDTAWIQATRANNLGAYDKLVINPYGGNVGIGTDSPTSELHLHVSGENNGAQIKFDSDYGIGYVGQENNTSNNLIIGSSTAGITFYAANEEKMRIDSSGNVGIGTSSPSGQLELERASNANYTGTFDFLGAALQISDDSNSSTYPTASAQMQFKVGTTGVAESYIAGLRESANRSSLAFGTQAGAAREERMRIDSSGNVGIGTDSPDGSDWNASSTLLHLYQNSTSGALLKLESSNTTVVMAAGNNQLQLGTIEAEPFNFYTSGTEAMRIDSSGNLIVGNTSVDASGSVSLKSDGNIRQVLASGAASDTLICGISGVSNGYQISVDTSNNQTYKWHNGGAQSMTLDSSGNLLVGQSSTTIPGVGNTTAGVSIRGDDGSFFSRSLGSGDTNNVLTINRSSNDGNILGFNFDGVSVGSIGVDNTDNLTISGNSSHCGLNFSTDDVNPYKNGAYTNGTTSLGTSSTRFKDIYLSGGVVFGDAGGSGTSSSNTFDSYEEGNWTPTVTAASGTITTQSGQVGTYTKIGREVSLHFQFSITNIGSASGNIIVSNLPFAKETATITYYLGIHRARSGTSSITEMDGTNLQLYGTTPINSTYIGSITYTST